MLRGITMLQRKVQRIHQSKLVAIPAQLCTMFGIDKGTIMRIDVENNKIVMTPVSGDQPDSLRSVPGNAKYNTER